MQKRYMLDPDHATLDSETQVHFDQVPLIAKSSVMRKILQDALLAAKSHAHIFIQGETGTGKEVLAKYIYKHSLRSHAPFVSVNCAAIPDTLVESEFFGHEKGAFTGAYQMRVGRFERAHKGTLLLDEISELPLWLQPKLLRVIQEKELERVGSTSSKHVDVRLISTSNRNMKEAVDKNLFREDLFFRLHVIPFYIPPLRERKEDILPLAHFFLRKSARENGKQERVLSQKAEAKIIEYSWPGNVRELANMMERLTVMGLSPEIAPLELSLEGKKSYHPLTLQDAEKEHIIEMLKLCNDNKLQTAKILDISVKTLRSKIRQIFPYDES